MSAAATGAGVLELDERSLLVRASASARIADLEAALAGRGLTLGQPHAGEWTLGAALEWAVPALRSPRYGRLIDACAGLRAVLRDGREVIARPAPRRAAGPDWTAMIVGRRGALAVIREAWLRVWPRPGAERAFGFSFPARREALCAARAAARADVRPFTWRVTGRRLCGVLHGSAAIAAAEAAALDDAAARFGGAPAAPAGHSPIPAGCEHRSWRALLAADGPVFEPTLDGALAAGAAAGLGSGPGVPAQPGTRAP